MLTLLSACGGGGGGDSSTLGTNLQAVSVSVSRTGKGVEVGVSGFNEGSQSVTATSGITNTDNASGGATANSAGSLLSVTATAAQAVANFSTASGDTFRDARPNTLSLATKADGTAQGAFSKTSAFDYQSFGAWEQDLDTGGGRIAAVSLGDNTPAAAIPTNGSLTYNGALSGVYLSPTGTRYFTGGDVELRADFANRDLTFNASNTILTQNFIDYISGQTLDMQGNLSFAAGSTEFSGIVSNQVQQNVNVEGEFFGPNADEVGGVFDMRGLQLETYIGSFGAKQ